MTQTQVIGGFAAYRETGNTIKKLGVPKYQKSSERACLVI